MSFTQLIVKEAARETPITISPAKERAGDLQALSAAGYAVDMTVVYRAVASETILPDAIVRAAKTDAIDAVLHFSRRSAAVLLSLARGRHACAVIY